MSDLTKLIETAVVNSMTPDAINEKIEKRVADLIEGAINDALRPYSDTGKIISEAVKNSLLIKDLELPAYGATVSTMLKAQIEKVVADSLAGKLADNMTELLSLAPKTIKLSQIVNEYKESATFLDHGLESVSCGEELVTFIIDENRNDSYSSRWVYLGDKPEIDKHRCRVRLLLSADGTIAGATFDGKELNGGRSIGHSYGFEQKIRAYYAAGTIIEIDERDIDVCGTGDF